MTRAPASIGFDRTDISAAGLLLRAGLLLCAGLASLGLTGP
jgi:hypothetical protein